MLWKPFVKITSVKIVYFSYCRAGLFGRVPFRLSGDGEGCISCGIQLANDLMTTSGADGHVILITASPTRPSDTDSLESVLNQQPAFPNLHTVVFNPQQIDLEAGQLFKLSTTTHVVDNSQVLQSLTDVLVSVLNWRGAGMGRNGRVVVKTYEKFFDKRELQFAGNFVVEDNLRNNLWMIVTSDGLEEVKYFEVTSPTGVTHELPSFNNDIVHFRFSGLEEAGIWSYKIQVAPSNRHTEKAGKVSIEVFGQESDSNSGSVRVDGWTGVKGAGHARANDSAEAPLVVYARVTLGSDLPVAGADVEATITTPGGDIRELKLVDNGQGYPDITSNDGIYSGYFTGFGPEEGLYTVSILASNSRGKAAVPRTGLYSTANDDCCGSVQQPSFQPTGPFRRIISAPAFAVEQGLEYYVDNGVARMRDPFPPGRVTDLAVQTYVNGTLYATLKWSAPGDNFYSDGAADHYELRCHTDRNFSAIFDQVHNNPVTLVASILFHRLVSTGLSVSARLYYNLIILTIFIFFAGWNSCTSEPPPSPLRDSRR